MKRTMPMRLTALVGGLREAGDPEARGRILAEIITEAQELGPAYEKAVPELVASVASRLLADLPGRTTADQELSRIWQKYSPMDPDALRTGQLHSAASLLYDQARYETAIPLFRRLRAAQPENVRAALLLAYSYEAVGREERDPARLTQGIDILQGYVDHRDSEIAAEAHHGLGHLHLGRYLVTARPSSLDRRHGIAHLRDAVAANPGYTSCLTSSFAEIGDYVSTIRESLLTLGDQRHRARLSSDLADTVEMEIIFYLAHGYSCVGEYDRATSCLEAFAKRMHMLGRQEAHDHAQLFLVKTQLKRSMLHDLDIETVRQMAQQLRGLAFRSRSARTVAAELMRYEQILDFLESLIAFMTMSSPEGWRTLVARGESVVHYLSDVPGLAERPALSILLGSQSQGQSSWGALGHAVEVITLGSDGSAPQLVIRGDVIGLEQPTAAEFIRSVAAFSASYYLAVLDPAESVLNAGGDMCDVFSSRDDYEQSIVVGTALALSKRFLIQDRYVFALAPCEDSPALRFQRPIHDLTMCLE